MTEKTAEAPPADAYELLAALRVQLGRDKEAAGRAKEAELYAAAVAGEPLVAITPFQANGVKYEPGDEIHLSPESKLLGDRWCTTRSRWTGGIEARKRALFYRDSIAPAEALAARMVREEAEAHRRAEAARIAAVDAQIEATRASDRRELAENELLLLLLDGDQGLAPAGSR